MNDTVKKRIYFMIVKDSILPEDTLPMVQQMLHPDEYVFQYDLDNLEEIAREMVAEEEAETPENQEKWMYAVLAIVLSQLQSVVPRTQTGELDLGGVSDIFSTISAFQEAPDTDTYRELYTLLPKDIQTQLDQTPRFP